MVIIRVWNPRKPTCSFTRCTRWRARGCEPFVAFKAQVGEWTLHPEKEQLSQPVCRELLTESLQLPGCGFLPGDVRWCTICPWFVEHTNVNRFRQVLVTYPLRLFLLLLFYFVVLLTGTGAILIIFWSSKSSHVQPSVNIRSKWVNASPLNQKLTPQNQPLQCLELMAFRENCRLHHAWFISPYFIHPKTEGMKISDITPREN